MRYLLILCLLLSSCSIPIKLSYDRKLLRLRNSNIVITKAISMVGKITEAQAITLWENYKASGIKGFDKYLIKFNPYEVRDIYYINFVKGVKARTKILKRGYYEKIWQNR